MENILFQNIEDPRVLGRYRHKLSDILFIAFSNLIYNKEDFEDMELVGNENITWLQGYLELPNSIPSHDTFNRVLSILKPASLQKI
jgi:hypothetical protein